MEMKLGGIAARRRAKNPERFSSDENGSTPIPKSPAMRLRLGSDTSTTSLTDPNHTPTPPLSLIPKVEGLAFDDESERKRFEEFAFNKGKFINAKPFDPNDFQTLKPLGQGIGGVVEAVKHKPTGMILARKMIHLDLKPKQREQIMRELKIMHECNSSSVVGFFGSFHYNSEINVLMEYMDVGSLEGVINRVNRIPEDVCGRILYKGLSGLQYLKVEHKIIHRDVKPSNVLVNSAGEIKLCDFGVSGQLEESLLMSFVGTRFYMAPERLEGSKYAIQSDIWSFGVTLIEILTGVYPIPPPKVALTPERLAPILKNPEELSSKREKMMSVFELLSYIVEEDPPALPTNLGFSDLVLDFATTCCMKDPAKRKDYKTLLVHPWITRCVETKINMRDWALSTLTLKERQALHK
eukprot:m.259094 g.259094  ORF g.259094 m.259094 type:complete len:409 (-) comp37582_c0_seq1:391-1617(-)